MTKLEKLFCIGLCFCAAACNNPAPKPTETEFTDSVAEALAAGGSIDLDQLRWTREPAACAIKGDTISITTAPHTDLWQRTYYHFRNDNAPVLQMRTREQYFSFVVKTDFTQSHQRFDQCGRGIPASGQRRHQQWLLRLGHDGHSRRCQDHVVSFLPPGR